MKTKYKIIDQSAIVETYFHLIRNLSDKEKIELMARISNSLLQDREQVPTQKTKEQILLETYGVFESDKSADEIIDEIYRSRCFVEKNYNL